MPDRNWEEQLMANIRKNIAFTLETHYGNNQASMAKALDIKSNTLHTYINAGTKPPVTFIYKLCSRHGITVDDFLTGDLSGNNERARKKEAVRQFFIRYAGSYHTYFFVVDSNSLKEGLIQEGHMDVDESGNISFEILNTGKRFIGSVTASDELIFFDFKSVKEKISIVIKNPGKGIREKYIGGMGIINISSPEDNRIPAAQKIIISRAAIQIDKYFKTLAEFLEINTFIKIRKGSLINLLTVIMNVSSEKLLKLRGLLEDSRISDEDKLIIGEGQLSLLQEVLDKEEYCKFEDYIRQNRNSGDVLPFNSIKISQSEDKMIYRFIKNEFKPILY